MRSKTMQVTPMRHRGMRVGTFFLGEYERLSLHARGMQVWSYDERNAVRHRKRHALSGLEQHANGRWREAEFFEAHVPPDGSRMLFCVVCMGPPACGGRHEALSDQVSDLPRSEACALR